MVSPALLTSSQAPLLPLWSHWLEWKAELGHTNPSTSFRLTQWHGRKMEGSSSCGCQPGETHILLAGVAEHYGNQA